MPSKKGGVATPSKRFHRKCKLLFWQSNSPLLRRRVRSALFFVPPPPIRTLFLESGCHYIQSLLTIAIYVKSAKLEWPCLGHLMGISKKMPKRRKSVWLGNLSGLAINLKIKRDLLCRLFSTSIPMGIKYIEKYNTTCSLNK